MSNKQYCTILASMVFGMAGITACDQSDDADLNRGVLDHGVAADDDDLDFTPVDDAVTFRTLVENGTVANGFRLNGFRLNGFRLNGFRLNGAVMNGAKRMGVVMSGLEFQSGSLLRAFDEGEQATRVGAQLNDMVFDIGFDPLSTGTDSAKKIKIKGVVQSGVQSDVYFYDVENEIEEGVFEAACLDGGGNPVDAIALKNTWDIETGARVELTDAITWACRGAALAKAVEWGYRPWVSTEMQNAHQAAVFMIRGDYCGEGIPHTSNGNAIDVSDKWGIQTSDTTWGIEAKWGPNGAVCLNTPRKLYHPRESINCAAALPTCTNSDPAEFGGMLMTRVVPNNDV